MDDLGVPVFQGNDGHIYLCELGLLVDISVDKVQLSTLRSAAGHHFIMVLTVNV